MSKTKKYVLWTLALIALVAFIIFLQNSPVAEFLEKENLRDFVSQFGAFSYVVYVLIYILASLILFPPAIITVAGGFIFGKVIGTILVVIAATIVAGIAFTISRYFSKRFYKSLEHPLVKKMIKKIDEQLDKNGLYTFCLLRMLFLPYMYLSYAAGLVKKAKFKDFILATFLTNIIGSFIFVYLGDQLGQGWKALIIPGILVLAFLLIPQVIKRLKDDI